MIVDAHVHVFRPADVAPRPVDALAPAERDAPAEDLLGLMSAAGVDRAVLVPLGPEDAYVAEVLRAHPQRFAAIAVVDEALLGRTADDPVAALRRRHERFGFHGVRTQWLGAPDQPLERSPVLPVLRQMASTGLVLWTYLTRDQLSLLAQLPALVPELPIVLNHLGFCPHAMTVDEHGRPAFADPFPPGSVDAVAALARHEAVHLMVSGQYALSRERPPYRDLDDVVARLADAFGAGRMLWASDYPWTRDVPGYGTLVDLPAATFRHASAAELAAIRGGTAAGLFPHFGDD
jgi:predicted TIM-barrel fold metal-dependent hydrolase